ncbi:MAG: LytTR family DNA-binding domain-containing protein, partial [Cryomorphaceae bacterium]
GTARSVDDAIAARRHTKPELLFLDIQLKQRSGFEILEHEFEFPIEVVFVTAYDQYAIQAFKNQALSYLLKPVDFNEFEVIIKRAQQILQGTIVRDAEVSPIKISIPRESETLYLPIDELIYVEASGSYCEVHTSSKGILLVSKPLKFIEDQLEGGELIRSHRSYLVNPHFIESWSKTSKQALKLKTGQVVPISRDGKKKVRAHFE